VLQLVTDHQRCCHDFYFFHLFGGWGVTSTFGGSSPLSRACDPLAERVNLENMYVESNIDDPSSFCHAKGRAKINSCHSPCGPLHLHVMPNWTGALCTNEGAAIVLRSGRSPFSCNTRQELASRLANKRAFHVRFNCASTDTRTERPVRSTYAETNRSAFADRRAGERERGDEREREGVFWLNRHRIADNFAASRCLN